MHLHGSSVSKEPSVGMRSGTCACMFTSLKVRWCDHSLQQFVVSLGPAIRGKAWPTAGHMITVALPASILLFCICSRSASPSSSIPPLAHVRATVLYASAFAASPSLSQSISCSIYSNVLCQRAAPFVIGRRIGQQHWPGGCLTC